MSRIKTGILTVILTALFCAFGYGLAGDIGIVTAFVLAACIHMSAYRWGDVILLRLHNAQELDGVNEPELFGMVQALAEIAHIPMPQVYVIPDSAPNACVVGRNSQHATLAVTTGLLDLLDSGELASVIAHELAHIKDHDILIMTVVAAFTGPLSRIADVNMWRVIFGQRRSTGNLTSQDAQNRLLRYMVTFLSAAIVQLTISRTRDFYADGMSAGLTGEPQALASALGKLERWNRFTPMQIGSPATSHLFIVDPFSHENWARLFRTHPPISDRITHLEARLHLQNRGD